MQYNSINSFKEHPLKKKVLRAKIRQVDLATAVGCSQGYLSQCLNGYRPLSQKMEWEIRKALRPFEPKPIRAKKVRKGKVKHV